MDVYKAGQGTRARALAAIIAMLLVLFGVSEAIQDLSSPANYIMAAIIVLVLGGGGVFFSFFNRRSVDFLIDTQSEMKKVAWPPWAEVRGSTTVVIVSVLIMAVFLYVVDFLLGWATQVVGIIPEA